MHPMHQMYPITPNAPDVPNYTQCTHYTYCTPLCPSRSLTVNRGEVGVDDADVEDFGCAAEAADEAVALAFDESDFEEVVVLREEEDLAVAAVRAAHGLRDGDLLLDLAQLPIDEDDLLPREDDEAVVEAGDRDDLAVELQALDDLAVEDDAVTSAVDDDLVLDREERLHVEAELVLVEF